MSEICNFTFLIRARARKHSHTHTHMLVYMYMCQIISRLTCRDRPNDAIREDMALLSVHVRVFDYSECATHLHVQTHVHNPIHLVRTTHNTSRHTYSRLREPKHL